MPIHPCLWPLLALLISASAQAEPPLPPDVARFVRQRDECDHFRGEEADDAARRHFLENRRQALCRGSDRQLRSLKQKYRGNSVVRARLADYDNNIEAGKE